MHTESEFDLIINGGGLVGSSLALDLASSGFRVALVDIRSFQDTDRSGADTRAIALTYSSGVIFRRLGLWDRLPSDSITAIRQTEVTDSSMRGVVQLRASDVGYDELGWNVEAQVIHDELHRCIDESEFVSMFDHSELCDLRIDDDRVTCNVESKDDQPTHALKAKVLVVADGGESGISDSLGFTGRQKQYEHHALVCRVECDWPNRQIAYEHFIRTGPLALLPSGDTGYSVVWTLEPDEAERLRMVTSDQFLDELQGIFEERVGRFVGLESERSVLSAQVQYVERICTPKSCGDRKCDAHISSGRRAGIQTLHCARQPKLAEILTRYRKLGWDISEVTMCFHNTSIDEGGESHAVAGFTDGLISIFANDYPAQSRIRNLGLDVIQAVPPLKRMLLKRTMGLHRMSITGRGGGKLLTGKHHEQARLRHHSCGRWTCRSRIRLCDEGFRLSHSCPGSGRVADTRS